MINHECQVRTGTARGECASNGAGLSRLTANAHKFQPTSKVQATVGRVFSLTPVSPTGPTGGASRLALFIPAFAHRVSSHGCCDRRIVVQPLRQSASLSRRFMSSRLQFRVREHGNRQVSNCSKRHVVNASLVRWFNANRHSERHLEPCSPNRGIEYPQ